MGEFLGTLLACFPLTLGLMLVVLGCYALFLLINALKIYIKKNS